MPIFGSKPKKVYVFIFYEITPPTEIQQENITSAISMRTRTNVKLGESFKLSEEQLNYSKKLFDSWAEATCYIHLSKKGIGSAGKLKFSTYSIDNFIVATLTGDID